MRRPCNKYINPPRRTRCGYLCVSELHSDRRALTGLRCLRGLRRRIADRRRRRFRRFDGYRRGVGESIGFTGNRGRRRRLNRLGTMSAPGKGKRGSGSVVRHSVDPRFAFHWSAARPVPLRCPSPLAGAKRPRRAAHAIRRRRHRPRVCRCRIRPNGCTASSG
jgi:hypothetical protein